MLFNFPQGDVLFSVTVYSERIHYNLKIVSKFLYNTDIYLKGQLSFDPETIKHCCEEITLSKFIFGWLYAYDQTFNTILPRNLDKAPIRRGEATYIEKLFLFNIALQKIKENQDEINNIIKFEKYKYDKYQLFLVERKKLDLNKELEKHSKYYDELLNKYNEKYGQWIPPKEEEYTDFLLDKLTLK